MAEIVLDRAAGFEHDAACAVQHVGAPDLDIGHLARPGRERAVDVIGGVRDPGGGGEVAGAGGVRRGAAAPSTALRAVPLPR